MGRHEGNSKGMEEKIIVRNGGNDPCKDSLHDVQEWESRFKKKKKKSIVKISLKYIVVNIL